MVDKLNAKPLDIYCYENSSKMDIQTLVRVLVGSISKNHVICIRYYHREMEQNDMTHRMFRMQMLTAMVQAIAEHKPNEYDLQTLNDYLSRYVTSKIDSVSKKKPYYQIEIDLDDVENSISVKQSS
jgi:hypothetical protein